MVSVGVVEMGWAARCMLPGCVVWRWQGWAAVMRVGMMGRASMRVGLGFKAGRRR